MIQDWNRSNAAAAADRHDPSFVADVKEEDEGDDYTDYEDFSIGHDIISAIGLYLSPTLLFVGIIGKMIAHAQYQSIIIFSYYSVYYCT